MNLKRFRPSILLFCLMAALLQFGTILAQEPFSQEGIPPGSDYVYRQHYAQVQEILKVPDVAQRESNLESFMKKLHPDSKILQYMESFFGEIVKAYQAKGQTAQANALTSKMMKLFPKSDSFLPQQFKAAFDSKDYPKAIELGEKIRAKTPNDGQVLVMLAQSYIATKNTAKVVEISPKVVSLLGANKAAYYVAWLADYYRNQRDMANAQKYYEMLHEAYPTSPPQGWEAAQWKSIKAITFQLRAGSAWAREDFQAVIEAYSESLKYDPTNDAAYLSIGLSYWRLKELDKAQAAFAKAVVLNKASAPKARQYLEQLYKPRNNDSLDGLEKVLEQAKAELKM